MPYQHYGKQHTLFLEHPLRDDARELRPHQLRGRIRATTPAAARHTGGRRRVLIALGCQLEI